MAVLRDWIEPGITVVSDCWYAYRDIETHCYTHKTVNHTISFVDVRTCTRTNTIENTCGVSRHFIITSRWWGTTSITWPTKCLRRGADPRSWTSSRHRFKHGRERHNYRRSQQCRQVTDRRPITGVHSPPATAKVCDITCYKTTNPLRSIKVKLRRGLLR